MASGDVKYRAKAGTQLGAPLRIGESCSFWSFRANNYMLHFLETLSGLKMVLNTDAKVRAQGTSRNYLHMRFCLRSKPGCYQLG